MFAYVVAVTVKVSLVLVSLTDLVAKLKFSNKRIKCMKRYDIALYVRSLKIQIYLLRYSFTYLPTYKMKKSVKAKRKIFLSKYC